MSDLKPSSNWTTAEWQAAYAERQASYIALEERTEKRLTLLKEQIRQRKQTEEALQRESDRLRLLQEVAVAANQAESIFVQEALTNAAKHANASRIEVTLSHDPDKISLLVADDGQGFQVDKQWPDTIPQINGMGLRGMGELLLLGGQLDIDSKPGRGTCLTAVIPCQTTREEA
ncbi:MAG: ATP-binding protein [Chloroflexota bacterium]